MQKPLRHILITVALLGAIAAVGCGKRNQPAKPAGNAPAPTPAAPAALPAAERPLKTPVTVFISMKGKRFLPAVVNAQVGDTIKWTNDDTVAHTVTGGEFTSPRIAPGESYAAAVTKDGTVDYRCTLHPEMAGKVVVRAAP
jgi:plastocyanin